MIITEITTDVRDTARFTKLNKQSDLAEYSRQIKDGDFETENVRVTHHVRMTPREWDEFTNDLLEDRDWLAEKGGTGSDFETKYDLDNERGHRALLNDREEFDLYVAQKFSLCLAVESIATGEKIYVDPQGYNYARYVGFPLDFDIEKYLPHQEENEEPKGVDGPIAPVPRGIGILVRNISSRDFVFHGIKHPGETATGMHAEIAKGESVRLFGTAYWETPNEEFYDITFKVGDTCVYHSYNLIYTGTITSIGEKVIIVDTGTKKKRLSLYDFNRRNWNYDAERIAQANMETSYYI